MWVQLDLTQSIRFLFHERRSSHFTSFSRGRTLGLAAFPAPASVTVHGLHKGGLFINLFFFLLGTGIRPRRSFDDYIKVPGLLRMKKPQHKITNLG